MRASNVVFPFGVSGGFDLVFRGVRVLPGLGVLPQKIWEEKGQRLADQDR